MQELVSFHFFKAEDAQILKGYGVLIKVHGMNSVGCMIR